LPISITASDAVASTDTAGAAAGGAVTITAGDAKRNTSGNANGGDITLNPGVGIGTGVAGGYQFPGVFRTAIGVRPVAGSVNDALTFGGGVVGAAPASAAIGSVIQYTSNALGQHFLIQGDTSGSGGPAMFRVGSGGTFVWRSATRSDSGVDDTGIARSAAGVVKVTDGSSGTGSLIATGIDSGAATNLLLKYNGATQATVDSIGLTFGTGKYLYSNGGGLLDAWRLVVRNRTSDGNEANGSMEFITNSGTTALVTRTLETATAGLNYEFYCADTDGLKIVANTGDDIRVIDKVTASAGYISSTTIGSVVRLFAIDSDHWVATSIHGTWTDGTFTYDDTSLTTP